MFKPARMTRLLVGGHRRHLEAVIEALHDEGVVHIEDYDDPSGIAHMGRTLPQGEAISEMLLRVRGLQKSLGVEDVAPRDLATDDPASLVAEAESAILPTVDRVVALRADAAAVSGEMAVYTPLQHAEVDLAALGGLESVHVVLGTVTEDPGVALAQAGIDADVQTSRADGRDLALVVTRAEDRTETDKVLATVGFSAYPVPADAVGTAAENVARLTGTLTTIESDLASLDGDLEELREKWATKLASIERFLAMQGAKSQAPLQFGMTERTFNIEGWVPAKRVNHLQNLLAHRFGDALYLEDLGDAPVAPEGHDDGHGHDNHHAATPAEEAPVSLVNKGPARSYEFMLGLLSKPRYNELDPTKLIAFFFPLFFGFMVGDFAVGLIIMGVALALRKYRVFGIGGDGVAKPMFWGGFWAMLIGLIIFGEALGLHFVLSDQYIEEGEHSWESVLGAHFPEEGFIHKTDGHGHGDHMDHGDAIHTEDAEHAGSATSHSGELQPLASEGEEAGGNPMAPHGGAHLSVNGWFNLGYYSKIHDVQALLIISVLIGLVHLVLGLVLGVRNIYVGHGLKLAIQEKVSWLLIMASAAVMILGINGDVPAMLWGGLGVFVVSVALLWMGVQHTLGAGFISILEIPSLLGNLLSYTRLAAIGASKAGMAIAFSTIGFELIGGAVGWIVYLLASALIIVLAILAGFLQSLRLQFVEFFSKFYEGGGRSFAPFGRGLQRPPSSP